jgi:hypothetical protein
MDLFYLGVVFAFFGLSWGLIRLCEELHHGATESPGRRS